MRNQINIVVINKAGKVGKSTISKHLIVPMLGAEWIQVETWNDTGTGSTQKVSGRKFGYVAQAVAASTANIVIDVGNSNFEEAKKEMMQIDGFVDQIDFWVVPCKENAGVQNDSISTVGVLINDLDVKPSKIIVIPNEVERPEEGLAGFDPVARAAVKFGFHFCPSPIVQNPKFDIFNTFPRSILEVADENIDYSALIVAAGTDLLKRDSLAEAMVLQGRARFLARNLRGVWAATPLSSLTANAVYA